MKKCPKCNVELPDNAEFCNNCGANLSATEEVKPEAPAASAEPTNNTTLENAKEANKNAKVGLIAIVAAVAVLVVILLIVLISSASSGYKKAIKSYMSAFQKSDVNTMTSLVVPKSIIDDFFDDCYDADFKDYCTAFSALSEEGWNAIKDEGKVKFEYEIKAAENINKLDDLKKDAKNYYDIKDLDDFKDMMEDYYDDYDFDANKISKCYIVEVKWDLLVDGDKEAKGTEYALVYKYGGSWYIEGTLPTIYDFYNSWSSDALDSEDFEDAYEAFYDAEEDFYDEL